MSITKDMDERCRLARMRKVLQAFENGQYIVCREKTSKGGWYKCQNPVWNFEVFEYKQEPFERYLNVYSNSVCSHNTKEDAENNASSDVLRVAVHVREVEDDC